MNDLVHGLGSAFLALACTVPAAWSQQSSSTIHLDVDATTISRKIISAHEAFPVIDPQAHVVDLVYPKWIPGDHSPVGPIADLVNLHFTADGKAVAWARDPVDMYRFHIPIPAGSKILVADFSSVGAYLAGNDFAIGNSSTPVQGDVNWDQIVLYPGRYFSRPGDGCCFDQTSREMVLRYCHASSGSAKWRSTIRPCFAHDAGRFPTDVRRVHA